MRKKLCCVLMMTLLLSACSAGGGENKAEEMALQARGEYLAMTHCSGSAKITADYGKRVYCYELDFSADEKETVLDLTAPETVAGIRAKLSAEAGSVLECDGAVLETGPLNEDGLTPLTAVPAILTALQKGYLDLCTLEQQAEEEVLRILIRDPEYELGTGLETTLWLDTKDYALLRGEMSQDGVCLIQCEFSSFSLRDEDK